MGRGTFSNGEFELFVSFRYHASPEELDKWRVCLTRVSEMLHYATHGDARFSTIYYANDFYGESSADAFVRADLIQSHVVVPNAFGKESQHMHLAASAAASPFIVLHEFGHHVFGLGDEYNANGPMCTAQQRDKVIVGPGDAADEACIMGSTPKTYSGTYPRTDRIAYDAVAQTWVVEKGWIREFCNPLNHVADNGSSQNALHEVPGQPNRGKSCAEVIQDQHTIRVEPWTGPNLAEDDHQAPQWLAADLTLDAALLLDDYVTAAPGAVAAAQDQGLMQSVNHFREVFVGPDALVEPIHFCAEPPHDAPTVLSSIDQAIEAGRNVINGSGRRAATQVIVLFSTGQNPISDPVELGRKLARDGILFRAVGSGGDRAGLQQLAQHSRGSYYEVEPERGSHIVRDHIMNLANQLRLGTPICRVSSGSLQGDEPPLMVTVEQGSAGLKLLLSHTSDESLQLLVKRPGGAEFLSEESEVTPLDGALTLSVRDPEPGDWEVQVEPPMGGDAVQYTLTAYSENPEIYIGLSGAQRVYQLGETINLYLVVSSPMPVVGLADPVARVTLPKRGTEEPASWALALEPRQGGAYQVSFKAEDPGAYEVEIDVRNEGGAVPVGGPEPDANISVPDIPLFSRVKRCQVHVTEASD